MDNFPTGSGEFSLISKSQTPTQLSSEFLKTFDRLLGLIEKQNNRKPSRAHPRKVRKEYLEKVKVLKRKLAKQSGSGVSDCMSMLSSIENYFYSNNEYSTGRDSYDCSESSLGMGSSYSRVEKRAHAEKYLIRQVLEDYYSSSKSHQGKRRQSHIKSYSFQKENNNVKDPANHYLVRKNKVAVLGALLQHVVKGSSLDSRKITAADFGLTNGIKVQVLESLLQEAIQKLNSINLQGYIDKESIRKVAVLHGLLKQTEHEAHINLKAFKGYKKCYKKLSSGDSSKLQRTVKFLTRNFFTNTRDKIIVLIELLQLAILEFNTNYKSEIFNENIGPNSFMPSTNRLPKNRFVFSACNSKSRLRNVLNLDSEIDNILKCGMNTGSGQRRNLKREISYNEFLPINTGQDKTVKNTWNLGTCPGYRNNPSLTGAIKQCNCGKCLSRHDGAIIDSLLNCNVENKVSIHRYCSKNLENEDIQTLPEKVFSKKHHLVVNCTQTNIEDTRDLLVNISCEGLRSNETCSQDISNVFTSTQTSKIVMQDECCVVNLPLKDTKSNQTDVIENLNISQQTEDSVLNQSIQTCKVTSCDSSIQSDFSSSPTIKITRSQEKKLCIEGKSNQSAEKAKQKCPVKTNSSSSEDVCDLWWEDVVISENYSEKPSCDGKAKEIKQKYKKEIEKLQSNEKYDLQQLMKDCSLSDITTKFEKHRQLLEFFMEDSSKSDSSSTSTSSKEYLYSRSIKKENCIGELLSDSENIPCCVNLVELNSNRFAKERCSLSDFDIVKFPINEFFSLNALEVGVESFVENVKSYSFTEDCEKKKSSM